MSSKSRVAMKKGSDKDECKTHRENRCITLRKEKREEGIDKRRRAPVEEAAIGAQVSAVTQMAELSIDLLPVYCEGELTAPSFIGALRILGAQTSHTPLASACPPRPASSYPSGQLHGRLTAPVSSKAPCAFESFSLRNRSRPLKAC